LNPRADALARAFAEPVSGPAYRPFTRVLALVVVLGLIAWGVRALHAAGVGFDAPRLAAAVAVGAALLWPLPSLLLGRTVLDATGIRQAGWMGRDVAWRDVDRVRFVRMPMAPRLLVAAGFGRMKVFYSGNAELDAAFARAVRILTAPSEELV
jgi:hypothetical protein